MPFTNFTSKTSKIWEYLKGDQTFSLQSRIYNSISVITIAVLVYSLLLSVFFVEINESLVTIFLLICVQVYLYYLSRYKGKSLLSSIVSMITISLFFSASYTIHSGIDGSALFSLLICYFMIIALVPKKQYWFWTIINISLVMGLIAWEYYHPEIKHQGYGSRVDRFIDIASTYLMSVLMIFACLSYIINNYSLEKQTAENNANVLAKLNNQKNQLISIISHDFNAPLNNISNYLYILSNMDIEDEVKKGMEKDLSQVTFDTQNLLLNLLSWSKSNMDGMKFQLESVNICDSLSETLRVYGSIAAKKNIVIQNRISDEINVTANFEMTEIVFRNLINNAIKFTPENGIIQISCETENNFHIISVSDTGLGISQEQQAEIFKSELSTTFGTRREKGVGLGLKICQEFIESLGGQIWFETNPGSGTTFFVKLATA